MRLLKPMRRGTYVGGHEAAAIVGAHPHLSRLEVWQKLTGQAVPMPATPAMERGLIVERGLARYFHDTAKPLEVFEDGGFASFHCDDDVPYFGGSPDGLVAAGDEILEVTTALNETRHRWGADGTDAVARHKWLQCQWYLGLTERFRAHVWCLVVDTDELLRFVVRRDADVVGMLRDASEQFWIDHVVGGSAPAPDGDVTVDHANILWPRALREWTPPTDDIIRAAHAYYAARGVEATAKKAKKAAAGTLRALLRDAGGTSWDGGTAHLGANRVKPHVDWQRMARRLAQQNAVDESDFAELAQRCVTTEAPGRQLRVYIRGAPHVAAADDEEG